MTDTATIVTKQVTVTFRGGGSHALGPYTLELPAGLRCRPVDPYPMQDRPQFWLDEFPADLFPKDSLIRHDAEHYGVWLEADQVTQS